MRIIFTGVLCATLLGIPQVARAQETPASAVAPHTQSKGYALLLEASALLQNGPESEAAATEKLSPEETLKRQRVAAARNAPALEKLREALKAGIVLPPEDYEAGDSFNVFAGSRALARQLSQQSAVRAADGDAMGAALSALDALDLSAQVGRGPIINSLVGMAIESLARLALERNAAPLLNAAQSRLVAERWEDRSARISTYEQTLRAEEAAVTKAMLTTIKEMDEPKMRAQAQAELDKGTLPEDEAQDLREALAIDFSQTPSEIQRVFKETIERAALPYQTANVGEAPSSKNPLVVSILNLLNAPSARFSVERHRLNNRLVVASLRLRAAKLDGDFPATFNAGIDPFSPTLSPLIYQRDGDKYLLYSVGPDGQDNGGAEIQTLLINETTGTQSVSSRLQPDSTGDIVAPVY